LNGAPGVDRYAAPKAEGFSRPAVILWFRAYALASALFYVLVEAELLLGADWRYGAASGRPALAAVVVLATLLVIFHCIAAFVPYRPWGWTLAFVSICFGLVSCTVIPSVVLVYFWLRPVTKAAFGRL